LGKTIKIASTLGAPPSNPRWHPTAVGSAYSLTRCYTHLLLQSFSAHDSSVNQSV